MMHPRIARERVVLRHVHARQFLQERDHVPDFRVRVRFSPRGHGCHLDAVIATMTTTVVTTEPITTVDVFMLAFPYPRACR